MNEEAAREIEIAIASAAGGIQDLVRALSQSRSQARAKADIEAALFPLRRAVKAAETAFEIVST